MWKSVEILLLFIMKGNAKTFTKMIYIFVSKFLNILRTTSKFQRTRKQINVTITKFPPGFYGTILRLITNTSSYWFEWIWYQNILTGSCHCSNLLKIFFCRKKKKTDLFELILSGDTICFPEEYCPRSHMKWEQHYVLFILIGNW